MLKYLYFKITYIVFRDVTRNACCREQIVHIVVLNWNTTHINKRYLILF